MSLLCTRGALSAKAFGFTSVGKLGWIGLFRNTTNTIETNATSISFTSTGGFYISNWYKTPSTSAENAQIAYFNNKAELQWQKIAGISGAILRPRFSFTDSSDNLNILSLTSSSLSVKGKYNTSGTSVSQTRYSNSSQYSGNDSSSNIYVADFTYTTFNAPNLARLNADNSVAWARGLTLGTLDLTPLAIDGDSSGNCYFLLQSSSTVILVKYDSVGTLQWQKNFTAGIPNNGTFLMCADNSGNIYIVKQDSVASSIIKLVKLDTSGTILFGKQYTINSTPTSVTVSNSGVIYIGIGGGYFILDSSGNFSYGVYLTSSAGSFQSVKISNVSSAGVMYAISDISNGTYGGYITYFHSLVSATPASGTYSVGGFTITYTPFFVSPTNLTVTNQNAGLTSSTKSITTATPSMTLTNTSFVSSAANI